MGQIKDGEFSYTKSYLLEQLQRQLEEQQSAIVADNEDSQSDNEENNNAKTGANATAVKVLDMASAIKDDRQQGKVVYRLDHVLLVSLLSALGSHTSCVAIADYWKNHRPFLEKALPDFPATDIAHDTVRRILMIASPKGLKDLFSKMVEPLIKLVVGRTVAVDGQAVRATGEAGKINSCRYIFTYYDTENGVALTQELVGEKTNETTVAPTLIKDLDLRGAVVTCDALNTRCNFARDLLAAGADYCMAIKENWSTLLRAMESAFDKEDDPDMRVLVEPSKGHGRTEKRTVKVLPASRLPKKLLKRWFGLAEGCIVKNTTEAVNNKTGKESSLDRYFITSLRFNNMEVAKQCATSIRRHWGIENELHYQMDVNFLQDKIQAKNGNYLLNRVRLNQLSHAIVNAIQKRRLKEDGKRTSKKRIMQSLLTPENALEELKKIYAI